jgi:RNA polymerase sporulation-specific sigma factor
MVVIMLNNKNFDTMTDEDIAVLASVGNNSAIDYLLDKYRNLVLIIARSYFLIGADRDDITQEGMIGLFKAIRDYKTDNDTSFSTFAHMCIKRQILSAIKTATRKKHLPLNTYISLNNTTYDDEQETTLLNVIIDKEKLSPEDIIIDKEAHDSILKSITEILSEYETTVLDKYLKGMCYTDIAAKLGKSEKSIDNALQRIKKKIEKHFR